MVVVEFKLCCCLFVIVWFVVVPFSLSCCCFIFCSKNFVIVMNFGVVVVGFILLLLCVFLIDVIFEHFLVVVLGLLVLVDGYKITFVCCFGVLVVFSSCCFEVFWTVLDYIIIS